MRELCVAAVQFEHRDGDKEYNLGRIEALARAAANVGAEVVCFHECSINGYTYLQHLTKEELEALAEPVPDGASVERLNAIAGALGVVLMAGLIERDAEGRCRKAYLAVDGSEQVLLHHRKLHPFIHRAIVPGDRFTVAEIRGVRFGCLICYDNNLPENVRITTLMGAEVIVMPHVTGATPSPMVGRGEIDPALWWNRHRDPARLRFEVDGPKGRGWLMRWLPARAWENGVYLIFSNAVGMDGGSVRPGCAMVLDPDGEVVSECRELGDGIAVARLVPEAWQRASGRRYLRARRPELYGKLVEPRAAGDEAATEPGWKVQYRGE